MSEFDGKTVLITGAAISQGRSHAVEFAKRGANVVICDNNTDIPTIPYKGGTREEFEETAEMVRAEGAECLAIEADVRDGEALRDIVAQATERFGGVDIACANAGVCSSAPVWEYTDDQIRDLLDINVIGVWQTIKATAPGMIERGGGSIVVTASINAMVPYANIAGYVASKHAALGLVRAAATDLGPHNVRINAVCPTTVPTHMSAIALPFFAPDVEEPTFDDAAHVFQAFHLLPVPWVEARDISEAVMWLASDKARYVTGIALPVDAGAIAQPPGYPVGAGVTYTQPQV